MTTSKRLASPDGVSSGMNAAVEMRRKWTTSLVSGEVSFRDIVTLSSNPDHKALSALKLLNILSAKPGWTEATAIESLRHAGLDTKDQIINIRKSARKIEIFDVMFTNANPGQWRARPDMPEGWPWRGKLSILVKNSGVSVEDISSLFDEEDVDDTLETIQTHPQGTTDGDEISEDDVESIFRT